MKILYFKPRLYVSKLTVVLFLFTILTACNDVSAKENNRGDTMTNEVPPISENVREILLNMQNFRVIFGHHSVGGNILDGLREIVQEVGANFQIADITTDLKTNNVHIADFGPGKNGDPKSKIDAFFEQMSKLPDNFNPDVALLKFCYVDFMPDSNVDEILAYYKKQINTLKNMHPKIRFVHCTVPMTARPTDIKSRIRRVLRLQVWEDASNISRTKFNNLLLEAFPNDPVFDLARIESIQQDGTRVEFTYEGRTYPSMAPEYTSDGGHLNRLGSRIVASEFVIFLNMLKTLDSQNI